MWSAFNFPAPWAATLFSVEALGMTIRLLSCQTLLHEYLLHSGYAIGAAISYYAMLYLYHYLMNGFYAQSFVEVARVRRLIGIRTKYLDSMNRSVKLALQYVSGCIQKFETTRVTALAANADKAMLSTLRNVQHIVSKLSCWIAQPLILVCLRLSLRMIS